MRTMLYAALSIAAITVSIAATSAPAMAYEYSTGGGGYGSGNNGPHKWILGSTVAECKEVTIIGSLSAPSINVKGKPTYANCTINSHTATVSATHCEYEFHEPLAGGIEFLASMSIISSGGTCTIVISQSSGGHCTADVAPGGPYKVIEEENVQHEAMKMIFDLVELAYSTNEECKGTGKGNNGEYKGIQDFEALYVI